MAMDLSHLNEPQRQAVLHGNGPLLILAGAGSGKTRAITHRIAHLVSERRIAPWRILAVTFTNKAAGEMRERLLKMLGEDALQLQVSTFHATGAGLLRREAEALGRTSSFVVYDDSDQLALLRKAMKAARLDDKVITPKQIAARIDAAKNLGQGPEEMPLPSETGLPRPTDDAQRAAKQVYGVYEEMLARANAFDFGDLLTKPVALFKKRPDILEKYRRRWVHVMVDEFQDTNPAQMELLHLLCPPGSNLVVVGDDDQAIYRWRGADVANILEFDRQQPGCRVVKLEQNYRSSANILDAAYAVVSKVPRRREKRLLTDQEPGLPLSLLATRDERGEAQAVLDGVRGLLAGGTTASEIAVFFRTHGQSRVLEEALRMGRVPYTLFKSRSFYDRAEIRDATAYLRLAVAPRSDADLLRVINVPPRAIGDTTVERLTTFAAQRGVSSYEALAAVDFIPDLNARSRKALQEFRTLVERLHQDAEGQSAAECLKNVLGLSGLLAMHEAEDSVEAENRVSNLQELVNAAAEFDKGWVEPEVGDAEDELDDGVPAPAEAAAPDAAPAEAIDGASDDVPPPEPFAATPVAGFLEQISLVGDADGGPPGEGQGASGKGPRVSLMTLHAAKGLEFDHVFLTGMEDNVFPHIRALNGDADPEELSEERRLCYVGLTRARKRLFLSLAQSRATFGEVRHNRPSRFIADIPKELFGFSAARIALATAPERRPAGRFDDDDGFVPDHDSSSFRRPSGGGRAGERVEYDPEFSAPRRPQFGSGRSSGPQVPKLRGPTAQSLPGLVSHPQFGQGVVEAREGTGQDAKVSVRFPGIGLKKVLARFLTPV